MRIFKIIAICLSSLVALVILIAFIVIRFYEDEVINYALNEAKSNFTSKVDFAKADLTFWHSFPNVSIEFDKVYIEETFETKDTLIYADHIYLEFNIVDLFKGKYDVHTIELVNSKCNLKKNIKGENNWHFWKSDKQDTGNFQLSLKEIELTNTRFNYVDKKSDVLIDLYSEASSAAGNFLDDNFSLEITTNSILNKVLIQGESYATQQKTKLTSSLQVNSANEEYTLTEGEIEWSETLFKLAGFYNPKEFDFQVQAENVELDDMRNSLPTSVQKPLNKYNADGNLDLHIAFHQILNKPIEINATCKIKEGEIEHKESGASIDNMVCELKYTNKNNADILNLRNLKANLNGGYMEANGTIQNLSQPSVNLQFKTQVELNALKDFFTLDTLDICEGMLVSSNTIKGKLTKNKIDSTFNWNQIELSGESNLSEASFRIKNSNREFKTIGAQISYSNQTAQIKYLNGTVNGSDFKITGSIENLLPFLTNKDEKMTLKADLKSDLIDFTNLVETSKSSTQNESYHLELPHRINFNMETQIAKFVFRKFEATAINGRIEMVNKRLIVDPVTFQTADGTFASQVTLEEIGNDLFRLNSLSNMKSINIQRLFTEFENFDQTFIQDKHLKGEANATIQFRTNLTSSLSIASNSIESLIDISIVNGELNNFESLQDISTYIKNNSFAAPFVDEDQFAQKMKAIKFSKLENVIEIKDRIIHIPQMDIRSTAMDINAKGTHSFDNVMNYTIGFSLRDLIVKQSSEWQVEDDGLGKKLFVTMSGTPDKTIFFIDKEAAKQNRQEEIALEKQNVKALLKQEFGLFKNDKSIGSVKTTQPKSGTSATLEWDEFDGTKEEKPNSSASKTNETIKKPETKAENSKNNSPKKKVPKWLEEKKSPE